MISEQLFDRYIQTRDESAFEQLHETMAPWLARLALRFASEEDAPDVSQMAWMRLLALGALRDGTTVRQALRIFVIQATIDLAKRAKTRGEETYEVESLAEPSSSPEEATKLSQLLGGLPEPERAVVGLVAIEGYPIVEAASMLKVSLSTSKRRLRAGLAKLAEHYSRGGDGLHAEEELAA